MFQEDYTNLEYFAFAFIVVSLLLLAYAFLRHAKEITVFFLRGLWITLLYELFWPLFGGDSEEHKSKKKK